MVRRKRTRAPTCASTGRGRTSFTRVAPLRPFALPLIAITFSTFPRVVPADSTEYVYRGNTCQLPPLSPKVFWPLRLTVWLRHRLLVAVPPKPPLRRIVQIYYPRFRSKIKHRFELCVRIKHILLMFRDRKS